MTTEQDFINLLVDFADGILNMAKACARNHPTLSEKEAARLEILSAIEQLAKRLAKP